MYTFTYYFTAIISFMLSLLAGFTYGGYTMRKVSWFAPVAVTISAAVLLVIHLMMSLSLCTP